MHFVSEYLHVRTRMQIDMHTHAGRQCINVPAIFSCMNAYICIQMHACIFLQVNEMWSGLGYYRRARMLHEGAKFVMEKCVLVRICTCFVIFDDDWMMPTLLDACYLPLVVG